MSAFTIRIMDDPKNGHVPIIQFPPVFFMVSQLPE